MIEVEQLTKRYGARTAVDDVSFRVARGEIVGFLGPNGAGKSTTLRMITGFVAPTEGRIQIDGIDALDDAVEARRRIGYMAEGVPIYPELRVHEYLRHRAALKGVPRRAVKDRVETALGLAGVGDAADRIVGQLSKGYRQRVGLADALVADPPLLILDEPTAGLDPNQIRQVRDLVRGFAGKKTVFLSTHILPEVEATCERVVIIHQGRIVGEGAPSAIRGRAVQGQMITVVGRAPRDRLEKIVGAVEGVREIADANEPEAGIARIRARAIEGADVLEAIFAAVASEGLVLRELSREAERLEDVFASLTTRELHPEAEADEEEDDEDEQADEDDEAEEEDARERSEPPRSGEGGQSPPQPSPPKKEDPT